MYETFNYTQKFLGAAFMTFLSGVIGGWDLSLQVLLVVVVVDIISGTYKGIKNGELSSKRIREGLMTKSGYLLVLILVHQFDLLFGYEEPVLRTVTAWLYIFTEAVSVIENLYEIGIPIPKKLYCILMTVKDKTGGTMVDADFENLKKPNNEEE